MERFSSCLGEFLVSRRRWTLLMADMQRRNLVTLWESRKLSN